MDHNNRDDRIIGIAGLLVAAGLIGLLFFLSFTRIDRWLKMKAIDDCARSSKYEKNIPDENTKVSYPVLDIYKNCIKDKGF